MKCAWCGKREADVGMTTCWYCRSGQGRVKNKVLNWRDEVRICEICLKEFRPKMRVQFTCSSKCSTEREKLRRAEKARMKKVKKSRMRSHGVRL